MVQAVTQGGVKDAVVINGHVLVDTHKSADITRRTCSCGRQRLEYTDRQGQRQVGGSDLTQPCPLAE